MKTFNFWHKWLIVAISFIILFGLFLVTCTQTSLFKPFDILFKTRFNLSPGPSVYDSMIKWIYGVLGAIMIGWGVFIQFILHNAFYRKERWAYFAMVFGILAWFIPDTAISAIIGAYFNVVGNILLLFFIGYPLYSVYKDFEK